MQLSQNGVRAKMIELVNSKIELKGSNITLHHSKDFIKLHGTRRFAVRMLYITALADKYPQNNLIELLCS